MSLIKEVEVSELARMKENGEAVRIIDIRQAVEVSGGTIPNAEAIPMHVIPLRINELKQDETLIMVCRSGARSAQGVGFMAQQGFENVYNLRGGIIAWAQNGMPLMA